MPSWETIILLLVFGFFISQGIRFLLFQSKLPQIERERILGVNLSKLPNWQRQEFVNRHLGPRSASSSIAIILIVVAVFLFLLFLGPT